MLDQDLDRMIDSLIRQEHLPDSYRQTVDRVVLPVAKDLCRRRNNANRPLLVGIHGAQGTGKSTLSLFLQRLLAGALNCRCARFSLDDIYLTLAERERLAETVHPLLKTRGVPGTHDLVLGQQLIDQLMALSDGEHATIPAFDKASDDRFPHSRWTELEGPVDVILVEGWCLGALAEKDTTVLETPINDLEREEDANGKWRRYVNYRLATDYRDFFSQMDCLIMLRAPSMECVLEWRTLQEHKLARQREGAPNSCELAVAAPSRIMSDQEVKRFIMHYERITRASLAEMPARADILIEVDDAHGLGSPIYRDQS